MSKKYILVPLKVLLFNNCLDVKDIINVLDEQKLMFKLVQQKLPQAKLVTPIEQDSIQFKIENPTPEQLQIANEIGLIERKQIEFSSECIDFN